MKWSISREVGFWNPRSYLPLLHGTKSTASKFPPLICHRLHHEHGGFVYRKGQKAWNEFKNWCFYRLRLLTLTPANVFTYFPLASLLRKTLKQWPHFPLRKPNIEHEGLRHYIASHFLTLHPIFVLWHFFYIHLFDRPLFLADVLWDRKRGPPSHVLNSYSPTSLYLCLSVITLFPWSWEVTAKVSSNSHLWKMQSGLLWYQRDCLFIHLIFNLFSNLLFWVYLPFHTFYNKVQKIWFFHTEFLRHNIVGLSCNLSLTLK